MIKISQPWKEVHDEWTYLKAKVSIDSKDAESYVEYCNLPDNYSCVKYIDKEYVNTISGEGELWFSVNNKYGTGLCDDRADAFVVSLLHYAMVSGADISVEGYLSTELLYNIRTEIVPHLCTGQFKPIRINALHETDMPAELNRCAATGMSCGIDSFYSLWRNTKEDIPDNYRIRYLTFFNVGAINTVISDSVTLDRRNQMMYAISIEKAKNAEIISKEYNDVDFVFLNSNISDYYRGMLVNSAHYRNCGAAMALQNLWNVYYYSSAGFRPDDVKYDLCDDPAYHEEMLCSCLSNGTIRFYPAGHALNRVQKTMAISDFPIAQKYLTVCDNNENCGRCNKCKRTIATLFAIGKIDSFRERFEVSDINSHILYWKVYIFLKKRDHYYEEIYDVANERGLYTFLLKMMLYPIEFIVFYLRKLRIYKKWRVRKYKNRTQLVD